MGLNQRSIKFINPGFQIPFLMFFTSIFLLNLVILKTFVFFAFKNFSHKLIEAGLPAGSVVFSFLQTQKDEINTAIYITTLIGTLVTIAGGYFISHRIAGPIYRIRKDILQILQSGKKQKIKLRTGDYFPELADAVNELITNKMDIDNEKK